MPRRTAQPGLPRLWNARRGVACAWLTLIGILQTIGTIALSTSAAALLNGEKLVHGVPVLAALCSATVIALGSFIVQNRSAERFALSYVHDARLAYAQRVLLLPFDGKSPELGLSLTRLVNDLAAIKLWLSRGLLALVTLIATIATLIGWMALTERTFLMPLVSCLLIWCLCVAAILAPLRVSIRRARSKRGVLAVLLGRALPERLSLLLHGKLNPLLDRLARTSAEVCRLLVTRATWSGALRAVSRATFPCAVGIFAFTGDTDGPEIALFLLIFAFVSVQLEAGAAGLEYYEANRVAREKLGRVFALPAITPLAKLQGQRLDWQEPIEIDALGLPSGKIFSACITPGKSNWIVLKASQDLRHIALSLAGLTQGGSQEKIRLGGTLFSDIDRKTLWRSIALVSPMNGFPAYQNKRPAVTLGARLDPQSEDGIAIQGLLPPGADCVPGAARKLPDPERSKIRIARALLRNPHLLVLYEDGLTGEDELSVRLTQIARDRGTTLVFLSKEAPA